MLTTLELRWFCPGALPAPVTQWFEQLDPEAGAIAPEAREDQYLLAPGCDYLGIKLRQGRLEVKWRQGETAPNPFGSQAEGRVELWRKWICADPDTELQLPLASSGARNWMGVAKARSQRRYQVGPHEALVLVPEGSVPESTCAVELTQLQIQDQTWWSLGFEAAGPMPELSNQLRTVANRLLQNYPGTELQSQNSYAYPHWLTLVVNSGLSEPEIPC